MNKSEDNNTAKVKLPTEDEISKAMEVLGISETPKVEETPLEKAKTELNRLVESEAADEELQKAMDEVAAQEDLEKANTKSEDADEDDEGEDTGDDDLGSKMKTKSKKAITKAKTKAEDSEDDDDDGKSDVYMKKADSEDEYEKYSKKDGEMKKSEDGVTYVKDEKGGFKAANGGETSTPELQKSMEDGFKGLSDKQDEMSKAVGTVLLDSKKSNEEFQKSIEDRLTAIENGTPGRKSALNKGHVDKEFEKGAESIIDNRPVIDPNAISVSRDIPLVGNIIEKAMYAPLEKGGDAIDPLFEKALTVWEVSKSVDAPTRQALKNKFSVNLVD